MSKRKKKEIEEEYQKLIEERQQALMQYPEQYIRDFAAAFREFLIRQHPELDPDDPEIQDALRQSFAYTTESMTLTRQYNLAVPWDPKGEELPWPAITPPCREIRCQESAISQHDLRQNKIDLGRQKVGGRYLIVEIDLGKPLSEIEDCVKRHVTQRKKKIQTHGSYQELVRAPEVRQVNNKFVFAKMQVWEMVEKERGDVAEPKSKMLWRLAENLCREKTKYANFKDDPDFDDKRRAKYKALTNAYQRDAKLYFGD